MKRKRWNDADSSGDWKLVDGMLRPRRYNKNTLLPILMILMPVIVLTLVMLIAGSQEKSVAADKDQVKVDEAVEGRP